MKAWFRSSLGRRVTIVLCILLLPDLGWGQEAIDPNKVKAAFLRNFAHYVSWPDKAFADAGSPWHVCILGKDPFGGVLDDTLAGRTEQGRLFEIFRARRLEDLPTCHILYLAYDDAGERRAALTLLGNRPVLTVGDAGDFLFEGGMIRFHVEERVMMSINLDRTRTASLRIQTKMLEVSYQALENGTMRTLR